jgi:hypothetical protein
MCFDSTKMSDYWHIPSILVCPADFLWFQMFVLIGADSFSFLIASLSGNIGGIYSLANGNPVLLLAERLLGGSYHLTVHS